MGVGRIVLVFLVNTVQGRRDGEGAIDFAPLNENRAPRHGMVRRLGRMGGVGGVDNPIRRVHDRFMFHSPN